MTFDNDLFNRKSSLADAHDLEAGEGCGRLRRVHRATMPDLRRVSNRSSSHQSSLHSCKQSLTIMNNNRE